MSSIASRIAVVGLLLYASEVGSRTHLAAQDGPRPEPLPREMPRASSAPREAQPERLPSPHVIASEIAGPESSSFFQPCTRTNRYDVWQFYAVDRHGRFRPRVVYSPYGSYYLYDGRPYPWISTHQLDFMPYAVSN